MKFKTACLAASLAAAGLATTGMAHAQSSVTLYGIVDVSMEAYNNAPTSDGGSGTVTGMRSGGLSGSRWGVRGSEDLGNGMKAIFQLESGFNVGNGKPADSTRLFNRTAMAGVSSEWGQLTFGRQYTSGFTMMAPYVPGAYGSQYEPTTRMLPSRADNAAVYSHKFGGLNVGAYYAFTNQADQINYDASTTGSWGGALGYSFGNTFRIMAAYDQVHENTAPGSVTPLGKGENAFIGGRWDAGKFKMMGGYRYRSGKDSGVNGRDLSSDMYVIGAGYQIAPTTGVMITYHREEFRNAPAGYLGTTDDTWQQVALLASYGLSKRTNVYFAAAYAKDGAVNLGYAGDSGTAYTLAPGKSSQTAGAIGFRHMF